MAVSENDGTNWSELKTAGDWGGVVYGPYNGMIGVTRLYSVALSETQILNNFLATKPQ